MKLNYSKYGHCLRHERSTRKLQEVGYGQDQLKSVQALVGAKECDIYDVLRYISFRKDMLKRSDRMISSRELYYPTIDQPHQDFIDFVGHQYINRGVWELSQENLPKLIELRYETVADGINNLGEISLIKMSMMASEITI